MWQLFASICFLWWSTDCSGHYNLSFILIYQISEYLRRKRQKNLLCKAWWIDRAVEKLAALFKSEHSKALHESCYQLDSSLIQASLKLDKVVKEIRQLDWPFGLSDCSFSSWGRCSRIPRRYWWQLVWENQFKKHEDLSGTKWYYLFPLTEFWALCVFL